MGYRRTVARQRTGDEEPLDAIQRQRAGLEPARDSLAGRVLEMQRTHGNQTVTKVIQRRGETETNYAPTAANPKYANTSNEDLMKSGNGFIGQDAPNNIREGIAMLEELWFRTKNRGIGLNLARAYRKLGDQNRATFWDKVRTGEIKPGEEADGSREHA